MLTDILNKCYITIVYAFWFKKKKTKSYTAFLLR